MIALWIVIFIVTLIALVKSADYFTAYSEKLGLMLGLSSFIIGATIVAVGTSLPELVSVMFAAVGEGATQFVADTIVGSNVANALLIIGIGAMVARTLKVSTSLVDVDLPFFFMSMALFVFFAWDKVITWQEGIFLLIFFIIFVIYNAKAEADPQDADEMQSLREQYKNTDASQRRGQMAKYIGFIIVSMVVLAISAKYFIDSILTLSTLFGISSSLLTITVVAFGTSLPEILTSISAIRHGNHGMAVGNVFGSNTFNIALVGSIPAFFGNLTIDEMTFTIGLPFLVIATFAAIFTTFDNQVRIWEGVALLFLYGVFIAKIIQVI